MTVAAPSANGASTTSRSAPPRPIQRPPSALDLIRSADRTATGTTAGPEPAAAPQALPAQAPGFSSEQLAALTAPLDRANVRQREQGRSKVHYLEGCSLSTVTRSSSASSAPPGRGAAVVVVLAAINWADQEQEPRN